MYTLKVLRPFYLSGIVQETGSVFQIKDKALAFELRYNGKVEFVDAPAHKGAMTTETVGAMVHGAKPEDAAAKPEDAAAKPEDAAAKPEDAAAKPEPEKKDKHHE